MIAAAEREEIKMKKLFITVVSIFTTVDNLKASAIARHFNITATCADTDKYLRYNIVAHKELFQHESLNTLLDELQVKVKSYLLIKGSKPGESYKGLVLYFENNLTTS